MVDELRDNGDYCTSGLRGSRVTTFSLSVCNICLYTRSFPSATSPETIYKKHWRASIATISRSLRLVSWMAAGQPKLRHNRQPILKVTTRCRWSCTSQPCWRSCKASLDLFISYIMPIPSSVTVKRLLSMGKGILELKQVRQSDSHFEILVILKGNSKNSNLWVISCYTWIQFDRLCLIPFFNFHILWFL